VVLDPVTKSSSGKDLLDARGRRSLREEWLARVNWITPNLSELAELSGTALATTPDETANAARHLCNLAARQGNPGLRVVVTGGHAAKPDDLLLTPDGMEWLAGTWVETASTHGTGCAYSSALAARVALGDGDLAAAAAAKAYVSGALQHAYPMGKGRGPIDHFWQFRR
jgi:hydroxymethylpyrimidine/phosphomethylpyrimidine kinase